MMCRRSATYRPLKTLAVLGVTAFFLVACGGNGKPTPPDPPPPGNGEKQMSNGEQQMRITPLREYGSIAFSMNPVWGAAAGGTGTSRSAARDSAVARCKSNCTASCTCQEVLWFRNACGTLAKSADDTRAGVGWGRSEDIAGKNAIAACSTAGGQTCRVVTAANSGRPFTFCAKAGSATPDGGASTIPARSTSPTPSGNSYGSLAFSISGPSWGVAGHGVGNSQSSARNAALAKCRQNASSRSSSPDCQEVLWFQNACGSSAISQDDTRLGVDWGESESVARSKAIAACRTAGGQGCRVQTTTAGDTFAFCAKSGSATPTGQASPVPHRPTSTMREEPEPEPTASSYVSVSYGDHEGSRPGWAWAFGSGTSAAAAERAAQTICSNELGRTCRLTHDGVTNLCLAIAVSECPAASCNSPSVSQASESTRQAAINRAIRGCESGAPAAVRGTCKLATSENNQGGVECVGTAR